MIINDMSDTDYHAHEYIGSTTAKLYLESRQLFKDAVDGLHTVEDKGHFQQGRLIHMMVLEPDRFAECVTDTGPINPRTKQPYGRDSNKFKDWQKENPHITMVEPWIYTALQRMPDEIKDIFRDKDGIGESSVFHDRLKIKCRPDWLRGTHITDLKSILDINNCEKQIANLKYYFSAEWYKRTMFEETGKRHTLDLIFVEKKPPYRWKLFELDMDWEWIGRDRVDEVIAGITCARDTGDWSDTSDVRNIATPPNYMMENSYDAL